MITVFNIIGLICWVFVWGYIFISIGNQKQRISRLERIEKARMEKEIQEEINEFRKEIGLDDIMRTLELRTNEYTAKKRNIGKGISGITGERVSEIIDENKKSAGKKR